MNSVKAKLIGKHERQLVWSIWNSKSKIQSHLLGGKSLKIRVLVTYRLNRVLVQMCFTGGYPTFFHIQTDNWEIFQQLLCFMTTNAIYHVRILDLMYKEHRKLHILRRNPMEIYGSWGKHVHNILRLSWTNIYIISFHKEHSRETALSTIIRNNFHIPKSDIHSKLENWKT